MASAMNSLPPGFVIESPPDNARPARPKAPALPPGFVVERQPQTFQSLPAAPLRQQRQEDVAAPGIGDYASEFGNATVRGAAGTTAGILRGANVLTTDSPDEIRRTEEGITRLKTMTAKQATDFMRSLPARLSPAVAFNYQVAIRKLWDGKTDEAKSYLDRARGYTDTRPIDEQGLSKAAAAIEGAANKSFPQDPRFRGSITSDLGQGLGSTAAFLPIGLLTGGTGVAVAGAAAGADQGYQEATRDLAAQRRDDRGESYNSGLGTEAQVKALQAGRLSALPGASEVVPVETFIQQAPRFIPGLRPIAGSPAFKRFARAFGRVGTQVLAEGGQEAFQTWAGNVINQITVDPSQALDENVLYNFAIGGAVGGGMQTVMEGYGAATGGEPPSPQPPPPAAPPPGQGRAEPRLFPDQPPGPQAGPAAPPPPQQQAAPQPDQPAPARPAPPPGFVVEDAPASRVDPGDETYLRGAGYTPEQIADMNAPERAAAAQEARQQGVEPVPMPQPAEAAQARSKRHPAGPAIWANQDSDVPVTILDEPPQADPNTGELYQRVQHSGNQTGYVPFNELQPQQPAVTPPPPGTAPMAPRGTRQARQPVQTPDDLEAVRPVVNTEPSAAQAQAGNYQKAHVRIAGMDVTIENPRGSIRRSKDDADPWQSPALPADYGYIKRTTGRDGDQVDVYIGPDPQSDRVFVIDQMNLKTGKFDEHKAVLGAQELGQAVDLYVNSFDNPTLDRIGDVTEMSVDEFRQWVRDGRNTKRPAARAGVGTVTPNVPETPSQAFQPPSEAPEAIGQPQMAAPDQPDGSRYNPTTIRGEVQDALRRYLDGTGPVTPEAFARFAKIDVAEAGKALQYAGLRGGLIVGKNGNWRRPRTFKGPANVLDFIASIGGIKDVTGELRGMDLPKMTQFGPVVRKNGLHPDRVREQLIEAGYLFDPGRGTGRQQQTTVADVYDLIAQHMGGIQVFAAQDQAEADAIRVQRLNENMPDDWQPQNPVEGRFGPAVWADIQEFFADSGTTEESWSQGELRDAARLIAGGMEASNAFERVVVQNHNLLLDTEGLDPALEAAFQNGNPNVMVAFEDVPFPDLETPRDAVEQQGPQEAGNGAGPVGPDRLDGAGQAADAGPAAEVRGPGARGGQEGGRGQDAGPVSPATEPGAEGKPQLVIPGAEQDVRGAMQNAAKAPLKASAPQKGMDVGLFGSERDQTDMFDQPQVKAETTPTPQPAAAADETTTDGFRQDLISFAMRKNMTAGTASDNPYDSRLAGFAATHGGGTALLGKKAAAYVVSRGRAVQAEVLVAFDGKGRLVSDGVGREKVVGFSPEMADLIVDPNASVVVHHNHPSSWSLSSADLAYLAFPGLKVVWAHGNNRQYSYRASIPPDVRRAISPDRLSKLVFDAFTKVNSNLYNPIASVIRNGGLSVEDANLLIVHLTNQALHNAGLVDYFSTYTPSVPQAIYGAYSDVNFALRDYLQTTLGGPISEILAKAADVDRSARTVRSIGDMGLPSPYAEKPARQRTVEGRDDSAGQTGNSPEEVGSADQQLTFDGFSQARLSSSPVLNRFRFAISDRQSRELTAEINQIAQRILGRRLAAVSVTDRLPGDEDAYFDPNTGVIYIALQSVLDPRFNIRHEAIHALRQAGVLSEREWAVLSRMARTRWIEQYGIRERYGDLYRDRFDVTPDQLEELMVEEAIADAMAEQAMRPPGDDVVSRIFYRVRQFLRAVANMLAGRGFTTPEQILSNIEAGGVAQRRQGTGQGRGFLVPQRQESNQPPLSSRAPLRPPRNPGPGTFEAPAEERVIRALTDSTDTLLNRIRRGASAFMTGTRRNIQDAEIDLLRTQQAIEAASGPIPQSLNAYLAASLYPGRAAQRDQNLMRDVIEPLVQDIAARGLTLEQVDDFVMARHAPERNREVGKLHKPGTQFHEAMTNPAIVGGSGMSDDQAAAVIAQARSAGILADLEAVGDKILQINNQTLDSLYTEGLISADQHAELKEKYKFYVPLRGWDDVADQTHPDAPRTGRKYDIRGKEMQAALGRTSKADSPLAYTIMQARQAIVRTEKNRVGKRFLRLAQANPNPAFWEVNRRDMKRVIDRNTGYVRNAYDPGSTLAENVYAVKVGGKTYHVTLHHQGLVGAMKGIGGENMGSIAAAFHKINRYFAAINTSYDPEFIFRNFLRDLQQTGIVLQEEKIPGLTKSVIASLPKAAAGMNAMLQGDLTSEWARHAQEYADAGGKIGFMDRNDIEAEKKNLDALMAQATAGRAGQAWLAVKKQSLERLVRWNDTVENTLRLATYVALRNAGATQEKAAFAARELTVNFNRKGKYSPYINAGYLFFNASTQGAASLFMRLARSKTIRAVAGGIMVEAFLMDMLNRMIAGDDDDDKNRYDKIDGEIKNKNHIFMMPKWFEEKYGIPYFKVPLPLGWNFFHVAGTQASSAVVGAVSPFEAFGNIAWGFADAFNPLGSGSPLNMVAPTLLDPAIDIARNQDYFGENIVPRQFDETTPYAQRYKDNVAPWAKWMTDNLAALTGGSPERAGAIDVSPEWVEHLWDFATGGIGRLVTRTSSTIQSWQDAAEIEATKIPFARVFVGRDSRYADRDEYYRIRDAVHVTERELRARTAEGDTEGTARVRERYDREVKMIGMIDAAEKRMGQLRKMQKATKNALGMGEEARRKKLERISQEMDAVQFRIRSKWNELGNAAEQ